ncbi:class I SAM-dependent methyltransferase [Rossellomorea vietnamensis]|uniref:Class I SAM-dependent methyltransferase n=1 Tax=Rossellomorea vietnamensis TaxID=218284 RepID=A0A5D4KG29_9BACI|nr:class I SAM-dependent methyltransferase [Rossellomorea vietnamensis]TYR75829.1 class I SAM-dependent methyltransferase [Rossellomorea vietnamensis]
MAKPNWHEDFILHLASVIRPKTYVELGLYRCELFNKMAEFSDQLVGVDINAGAGKYMLNSPKAQFFHGTTQEFAENLEANPLKIDMLFIDADHSKEAVLQDFRNFFPYVVPHGLILFHDSHPRDNRMIQPSLCGTAYQAIEELSKERELFEMVTLPISPGVTICRKRKKQLSWHE